MVTVFVIWNDPEADLTGTLESVWKEENRTESGKSSSLEQQVRVTVIYPNNFLEKKTKTAGQFRNPLISWIELGEKDSCWPVLQEQIAAVETKFTAIVFAGEKYGGAGLQELCAVLERTEGAADCAVPVVGGLKSKQSKKAAEQLADLTDVQQLQTLPGVLAGMVFRTEAIKAEAFDPSYGVGTAEAFKYRILLKKSRLLLVKQTSFVTRSAFSMENGFCAQWKDAAWYLSCTEEFGLRLLKHYQQSTGEIPLLIQAQVLYLLHLQFYQNLDNRDKNAFTQEQRERYFALCGACLQLIEDRLFLQQKKVHADREIHAFCKSVFLQLKYPSVEEQYAHGRTAFPVVLHLMEYEEDRWKIDGAAEPFLVSGGGAFCVHFNGQELRAADAVMGQNGSSCAAEVHKTSENEKSRVEAEKKCLLCRSSRFCGVRFFGKLFERYAFHLEVPKSMLAAENKVVFGVKEAGKLERLAITTSRYQSRISNLVRGSYWCFETYMVRFQGNGTEKEGIEICQAGRLARIRQELNVLAHMPTGPNSSKKMFVQRLFYWIAYPKYHRKNIWLTFDKLYKGGDCGEYFYKYMESRKDTEVVPAYVIRQNAPDRKRLEQEGYRPLIYGTQRQKLHWLYAQMIFATHSSVHGFNGFNAWEVHFIQDRLRAVNTCIQHGLSVQDLTFDSNRIVNNNKRYYCASHCEVENLSKPAYDYAPDVLRLTGIPRYDGLVDQDKKQILITPTWRSYIAMPAVMGESRPYNPEFKNTDYYKIFQTLLENKVLSETAAKTGYRIVYLLHPVISSQKEDFRPANDIEIVSAVDVNYEKILTESSLMVTDYSGVQFDFAYMRKPVVYFHPPKLPPHYEEGGFFYDTQGFGEICREIDELVETLCSYMESGCELKPFYRARQNDFFAFEDRENCRRIYEDALQYQKETKEKWT